MSDANETTVVRRKDVRCGWESWPCPNEAKFEGFCGVHNPKMRAERRAKRGPTKADRNTVTQAQNWSHLAALEKVFVESKKSLTGGGQAGLQDAVEELEEIRREKD
jgi:hypothetical protein